MKKIRLATRRLAVLTEQWEIEVSDAFDATDDPTNHRRLTNELFFSNDWEEDDRIQLVEDDVDSSDFPVVTMVAVSR